MGRKGESIFLRNDGRYEARYIKGYDALKKAKYGFVYAKSYQEAKKKRNIMVLGYSNNVVKSVDVNADLFNQAIDMWLIHIKSRVKESTYSLYVQIVDKHIRPKFGKYKITEITNQVLEEYINEKLDGGRVDKKGGLSNKTVIDIVRVIKQILKYHGIVLNVSTIKKNLKNVEIFNINEVITIKNNTEYSDDRLLFGIYICLYTGMRIGEICALKNGDIDYYNGLISIKNTLIRIKNNDYDNSKKTKIIISKPKSVKSIRTIPLSDIMCERLKSFSGNKDDYFLTNSKRIMEPRCYYNFYRGNLEKWNIPYKKFHALRHTFATKCIESGFDVKALSEILGHANINITLNLYVHPTIEQKRKYMNLLF